MNLAQRKSQRRIQSAMTSSEPWVGTWRPHKPRGPIAALYGSPGPKYALPTLTGVSQHDPTKCRAPVFSFGSQLAMCSAECSPGPQYLIPSNITRRGHSGTPAFSLGQRTKEPMKFDVPGPGKYSPENAGKATFRAAPAYSLPGRVKELSKSKTPGPATYTLPPVLGPKTVVTAAAPTFSLFGRSKTGTFHEDLKKTPGPAAYKVVDTCVYSGRSPRYSMAGRNFAPGDTTKKPGPGAYNPGQVACTKAKAPSFSFGLRHSQYIAPLIINQPE